MAYSTGGRRPNRGQLQLEGGIESPATLAGTLKVAIFQTNTFVPAVGQVFDIMTYSKVIGNFDNFDPGILGTPNNKFYQVRLNSDAISALVTNKTKPLECRK